MILGIHCSVQHGFLRALHRAAALRCSAMQMLPYRRHLIPESPMFTEFRAKRARGTVRRLLTHSRYIPRLCSTDRARRRRSIELLRRELAWSAAWGAEAHVLHAGAWSEDSSREEGLRLAAQAVAEALDRAGVPLKVLVENVPGGGRRMGGALDDLARLLDALRRTGKECGVCLDTAHAWAAGNDISTAEGMLRFLARAERFLGPQSLQAFHLNNTRSLLGSQRDNHCAWAEGCLTPEALAALLSRPQYADRIGILEPPAAADAAQELDFVRRLASGVP